LLLTGDLTGTYEPYIKQRANILKVAHHGSVSSTTKTFIEAVDPQTAIISVSATSGAATAEGVVPKRLSEAGCQVFTTALCGAIRIDISGSEYRITPFLH